MSNDNITEEHNIFDHIAGAVACYFLAFITYYLIVNRIVDLQNCREHSKTANGEEITAEFAALIEKQMKSMFPDSGIVVYGYPKSAEVKGLSRLLLINKKNLEAEAKAYKLM
uniref:MotB_plug domain-containing protein n=1 Tax=Strongyloides stercoralis TaxID=6248 RepID=A0A0K0EMH3_STRER